MTGVPRLFPDSLMAILAGGPSLTAADVDACRAAGCHLLAIKDAVRLAPDAVALYSGEIRWWRHYGDGLTFAGLRYGIEAASPGPAVPAGLGQWGVTFLRNTGMLGLETDPTGVRTGKNSGMQALNVAVHLGAERIVLLGYDMQPNSKGQDHWFGEQPYVHAPIPYQAFHAGFASMVEPLAALAVEVVNCTPGSALHCFPMMTLADALGREVAA
jgi:hypothetical protein